MSGGVLLRRSHCFVFPKPMVISGEHSHQLEENTDRQKAGLPYINTTDSIYLSLLLTRK